MPQTSHLLLQLGVFWLHTNPYSSCYSLLIGVSLVSSLYPNCCCQNFFKPPGMWVCVTILKYSGLRTIRSSFPNPLFFISELSLPSSLPIQGLDLKQVSSSAVEVNKLKWWGECRGIAAAFVQRPNEWLPWSSSHNSAWPQSACNAAAWWICSQSGCQALTCQTQADNDRAICCFFSQYKTQQIWNVPHGSTVSHQASLPFNSSGLWVRNQSLPKTSG